MQPSSLLGPVCLLGEREGEQGENKKGEMSLSSAGYLAFSTPVQRSSSCVLGAVPYGTACDGSTNCSTQRPASSYGTVSTVQPAAVACHAYDRGCR